MPSLTINQTRWRKWNMKPHIALCKCSCPLSLPSPRAGDTDAGAQARCERSSVRGRASKSMNKLMQRTFLLKRAHENPLLLTTSVLLLSLLPGALAAERDFLSTPAAVSDNFRNQLGNVAVVSSSRSAEFTF